MPKMNLTRKKMLEISNYYYSALDGIYRFDDVQVMCSYLNINLGDLSSDYIKHRNKFFKESGFLRVFHENDLLKEVSDVKNK